MSISIGIRHIYTFNLNDFIVNLYLSIMSVPRLVVFYKVPMDSRTPKLSRCVKPDYWFFDKCAKSFYLHLQRYKCSKR